MTTAAKSDSSPATSGGMVRLALVLLPLALCWFKLWDHLRLEWAVNPQYAYGWAVPFLCGYLLWQKRAALQVGRKVGHVTPCAPSDDSITVGGAHEVTHPTHEMNALWIAAATALALLWLPTRLVGEANPDWRMVSWALALATVGLTLIFVRGGLGGATLQKLIFPIAFFLVAVPWPTIVEAPLIQSFARFNATACFELLGWLDIPAMQHGNVIEISTGLVGIEETCSGIRSFQASLMISLFLGEHYDLRRARRFVLVLGGFALAILFNIGRTTLLVVAASKKGIETVGQWHDPAGVPILVGCFLGVWAMGAWLAQHNVKAGKERGDRLQPTTTSARRLLPSVVLLVWLLVVEVGVETWYRAHERNETPPVTWSVNWPTNADQFSELPLGEKGRQFLRYDEGGNARWLEPDGTQAQAIFLRWNPGRVAVSLARNHTPEICLTASGRTLAGRPTTQVFTVQGLPLAFEVYQFDGLRVYYCLWADCASQTGSSSMEMTYANRLRQVREGRRNLGQRSLELAVWSKEPAEPLDARIAEHMKSLLRVERSDQSRAAH